MPRVMEKIVKPKNSREVVQCFETIKRNLSGSIVATLRLREIDLSKKDKQQLLNMLVILQTQREWAEEKANNIISSVIEEAQDK